MKFRYGLALSCSALSLMVSSEAAAQSTTAANSAAGADTTALGEVVVTAERRATNLQSTPAPIAAVELDAIKEAGVVDMSDLDKVVPDLNVFQGMGSLAVVTIRGIQPGNWDPTTEATTAVHLDGAILARSAALDGLFYDLERVEVLKGPQGTLYGRGATGGAINIITRKPQMGTFGGYGEAEYGNYDRQRVEGALNVPLASNWAARVAGRYSKRDGFYKDTGFLDENSRSVRAAVLGKVTDRLTLTLTGDYEKNRGLGSSWVPDQVVGGYGSFTVTNPEEPWRNAARWGVAVPYTVLNTEGWGAMAQLDYDLRVANLTLQYSRREVDDRSVALFGQQNLFITTRDAQGLGTAGRLGTLVDVFGARGVVFDSRLAHQSDSYEARLTSTTSGALEWIVGAFGFSESLENLITAGVFVNYWIDPQTVKSRAIYGQATYTIAERLHLTGGVRYTADKKTLTVDNTLPLTRPVGVAPIRAKWDEVTWKANVSYDITSANLIYAQASKGFKAGHIATSGAIADPETLIAYELGSKNRFFSNRLQLNGEFYYYDYKVYQAFANPQICRQRAPGSATTCLDQNGNGVIEQNIDTRPTSTTIAPGGAKQWGLSASLNWLITRNDQLTANVTYQHNKYGVYDTRSAILREFPDAQFLTNAGLLTGARFGGAPWRANIGYTHTFDLGDSGSLDLSGDLYYYGTQLDSVMRRNEPAEYRLPGVDSYILGDINLRFTSEDRRWFARAYVQNIANSQHLAAKTYTDLVSGRPFAPAQSGYVTGTYVQPRTFGLVVGANF